MHRSVSGGCGGCSVGFGGCSVGFGSGFTSVCGCGVCSVGFRSGFTSVCGFGLQVPGLYVASFNWIKPSTTLPDTFNVQCCVLQLNRMYSLELPRTRGMQSVLCVLRMRLTSDSEGIETGNIETRARFDGCFDGCIVGCFF